MRLIVELKSISKRQSAVVLSLPVVQRDISISQEKQSVAKIEPYDNCSKVKNYSINYTNL